MEAAKIQAVVPPIATRTGRKKTIVVKPAKVPTLGREYPRVAAVGRKRSEARLDREVAGFLKRTTSRQ